MSDKAILKTARSAEPELDIVTARGVDELCTVTFSKNLLIGGTEISGQTS